MKKHTRIDEHGASVTSVAEVWKLCREKHGVRDGIGAGMMSERCLCNLCDESLCEDEQGDNVNHILKSRTALITASATSSARADKQKEN